MKQPYRDTPTTSYRKPDPRYARHDKGLTTKQCVWMGVGLIVLVAGCVIYKFW